MASDPEIDAAFGGTPAAAAPSAPAADPEISAAYASLKPDMGEVYGTEAGPGYLLRNPEFWRGMGRGAISSFLSATAVNKQGAEREAQEWFQRFGLDKGQNIPEGIAGQAVGGFLAPLPGGPAGEAEGALEGSAQSISAAARSSRAAVANASPELQEAVHDIESSGGRVNPDVLDRHITAESLPIKPPPLTKGQATQDPVELSNEMNQRGKIPAIADRFDAQNQNLADNLQAIRDRAGPDVFTTNTTEHGDTMIQAYQAKNAAAEADIGQKYQALRDANGGQFPVDGKALLNNVSSALHQNLLFEHAPSAEMKQLQTLADKGMNLEQFEAMRTNLARIMRSSSDGNEVAAARIIRGQMEQLPMGSQTAQVKALADEARGAARKQFQALDADPAYKAAVNGTVTPDRFVNRFIVNGQRDNVALMRENLADNPTAQQTMGVAALDSLRSGARLDDLYRGNFAQSGFNKSLQALGPKVPYLLDPRDASSLQALGDTARWQQFQPRGSYVNTSNTATALAAHGRDFATDMAEGVANRAFPGAGTVGRILGKSILKGRQAAAFADEHLSPGAGLDYPGGP